MTFLALSPLQTVLLALVTAGIVIALYFLKLRHRRMFVSSSLLWGRVLDEQMVHSFRERLRRIISIAVAVTIALLIAIALARPEITSLGGRARRLVIVLDTSPSMNTRTADGSTRWLHAVAMAREIIDNGTMASEFRIADTSGTTAFPFTTDPVEARNLIDQLRPEGSVPRFPNIDSTDSTVYFVSDGVSVQDAPQFAERVSVFEPANNVAVTAFEIRPVPSNPLGYEAYLEAQNYGPPAAVQLTLSGKGNDSITRNVRLETNQKLKEVLDLSNFAGGTIQARVQADGDALPDDDVAFAYLPIQRKTRTLLVTRGNNYLQTLLRLNRHVELVTVNPANYREQPNIDAYVFDRFAPPAAPAKPALIFGAPAAAWLRNPQGFVQKPEITTWAEDHPIMQYVSVHDISIERAARIDPANLTVIAASRQIPLIVASEKPRWVMLTFDLDNSDFALQTGFPVFVENVLAWMSREQLALRRTPGTVEVPLANAQVRDSEGTLVPSQQQLGNTVFRTTQPGLYAVSQGDTRLQVAVNLTNPALSNINQSSFVSGTSPVSAGGWLSHELWFYMLLAAIVLISVEWLTYHRRITL